MTEREFQKLEEFLDEILSVKDRLSIPVLEMQRYESLLYHVASENPKNFEMLKLGICLLHKIYQANSLWGLGWMDTLEEETYRVLEKYVF